MIYLLIRLGPCPGSSLPCLPPCCLPLSWACAESCSLSCPLPCLGLTAHTEPPHQRDPLCPSTWVCPQPTQVLHPHWAAPHILLSAWIWYHDRLPSLPARALTLHQAAPCSLPLPGWVDALLTPLCTHTQPRSLCPPARHRCLPCTASPQDLGPVWERKKQRGRGREEL